MCDPKGSCNMECEDDSCKCSWPTCPEDDPNYCVPDSDGYCINCGRNVFGHTAPTTCSKLYGQRHAQADVNVGKPSLPYKADGIVSNRLHKRERRELS